MIFAADLPLVIGKVYHPTRLRIKNIWQEGQPTVPIRQATKEEFLESTKDDGIEQDPRVNLDDYYYYEVITD